LVGPSRPVREPAVAGTFYPGDPEALTEAIDLLLGRAAPKVEPDREIKALACPHAGYQYSGPVAAEAFACLKGRAVETVVLVGPDHYIGFEGIAIYPEGAFRTPLGDVDIDVDLVQLFLQGGVGVRAAPEAHRREHSLEVQLPFLQRVLPKARIVPVLMGFRSRTNVETLANLLSRALDNPKVVLLASTDLSHYHPREVARKLDGRVQELVRAFAPTSLWEDLREGRVEACGGDPLVSVMLGAGIAGAEGSMVLRYADSADANGEVRSVVGYLSAAFYRGMPPRKVEFEAHEVAVTPAEADALLSLAFEAARTPMEAPYPSLSVPRFTPGLRHPGRAFVTLRRGHELRGCIGTLEQGRPLWESVARAARAAAHEDPRFEPVRPEEMAEITVEVSVLSEPREVEGPNDVVAGRHGVIITSGHRRGLLLPQLAEEYGWDRDTLLAQACVKAGLPADAWRGNVRIEVFEAQVFQAGPGKPALNGGA
jgi:AmmeMemoRadiSam system protein B/AmmeMemoRadiSam system protein A